MRIHRYMRVGCSAFIIAAAALPARVFADNHGAPSAVHPITLLQSFRPIGGTGNNLANPNFNATPCSPELKLAPLNFAHSTVNGLIGGESPDYLERNLGRHWRSGTKWPDHRSCCLRMALCVGTICRSRSRSRSCAAHDRRDQHHHSCE